MPSRGRGAFNRGIYSNPEFDSVLDKALITLDRDARETLLIKATDIAFRDYAVAPLHHQFNIEAMAQDHPPHAAHRRPYPRRRSHAAGRTVEMADQHRMPTHHPRIIGTRHMVASANYLAAQAGFEILEAGGNAIDAGVAGGIALGVLQCEYVHFAGVAPIMIHLAETGETVSISGLGRWPKLASRRLVPRASGRPHPRPTSSAAWCRPRRTRGSPRWNATAP